MTDEGANALAMARQLSAPQKRLMLYRWNEQGVTWVAFKRGDLLPFQRLKLLGLITEKPDAFGLFPYTPIGQAVRRVLEEASAHA